MMIVGLSKLTDDDHSKYHQYDGWAGFALLLVRLGLCVYFMFGIRNTLNAAKAKVRGFVSKLAAGGILYFLSFPALLFISYFVAPYFQHKLIKYGMIALESAAIIIFHSLFTFKNTDYYVIS